jgi:hypothetical protein
MMSIETSLSELKLRKSKFYLNKTKIIFYFSKMLISIDSLKQENEKLKNEISDCKIIYIIYLNPYHN